MKKYFGLSNREETTLRYLSSIGGWADSVALFAVAAFATSTAVSRIMGYKNEKFIDFIKGIDVKDTTDATKVSASINSKIFVSVLAFLILSRIAIHFVVRGLESKVVSNYESTDGIERK